MSIEDVKSNFRKQSVLIFLVLSVITIWMYALAWYIRQTGILNRLLPNNKIPKAFVIFCSLMAIINVLFIPLEIFAEDDPAIIRISTVWGRLDIIVTIIWTFMIRNRINELRKGEPFWLNGLATLIFGPFYIQYKINRMLETPQVT